MPYCAKCGSEATGNFCPSCGAPIAAPAGPPPVSSPPPIGQPTLDPNMAAALCYFAGLVSGVLFLVLEPYNRDKTIRFHAFQSIFANVAVIATWFVLAILSRVWLIGLLFTVMLGIVLPLATIALWIILMYKAYN